MTHIALQRYIDGLCTAVNWNGALVCGKPRYHSGPHKFEYRPPVKQVCGAVLGIGKPAYPEGTCGRKFQHSGPHMADPTLVRTAGRDVRVHGEDQCFGTSCVIHDPSAHKMRDWPMMFRPDKGFLVERECIHGVGHPDPDSVMYFLQAKGPHMSYMWVHGCDGCCA